MKSPAATTWASHLLAVLAGAGIIQMARAPDTPSGRVKESSRSAPRDAGTAEVVRRLEVAREEDRQRLISLREEPDEPSTQETRTPAQRDLDWRTGWVEGDRKKLADLIKRSEDFRKAEDLRVPLMEALRQTGEDETAEAVFIEWYRRNPVAAMDELAARRDWSRTVLQEGALTLHLTPEVLVTQLGARNRSADFRETILKSVARHWLNRNDLRGLAAAYDRLGGPHAEALMTNFVQGEWISRDGAADLAFVSSGMSERCRKAFLTRLVNVSPSDGSREWAEGMAAPLFKQVLGEEKVLECRELAEAVARIPTGSGCGGGEDEFIDLPDHERVAKWMSDITPENESEALSGALSRLLGHDRDYYELFGSGSVTAEEIFQRLLPQIPGGSDHEAGVRRALYEDLLKWNPKAAVEWASGCLTESELQSISLESYEIGDDPRALRVLDLVEAFPLRFEDGKYVGQLAQSFYSDLEDWNILDAEAAAAAMSRSPKTVELAERLQKKPSDFEASPPAEESPDSPEHNPGDTEQ